MAEFFVTNRGLVAFLDNLISAWGQLKVCAAKAAFTPHHDDTVADYLPIECDFPGYARQDALNWRAAISYGVGRAVTTADVVVFTRSAGGAAQSAYGVFFVGPDGELRYAVVDPNGPAPMNSAGDEYAVIPAFRLREDSA
jgi:hypothetical protein